MPTPTIVIPFGESSGSGSLFAKVLLDSVENVDVYGNELTEFLDDELVNILVHTEPGAIISDISTSYGTIVNPNSPKTVTRTYTEDEVVFKGLDEIYTLPFFPSSSVSVTWKGNQRNLSLNDRNLKCLGGAGICSVSFSYQAKQYILQVPELGLQIGQDFPVEVSFNINK